MVPALFGRRIVALRCLLASLFILWRLASSADVNYRTPRTNSFADAGDLRCSHILDYFTPEMPILAALMATKPPIFRWLAA